MVSTERCSLRVVIIGAGIGGLTCAIACRQEGLDVVVLERAAEFKPVGAGIQLPANATRVMRKLGLYHQLDGQGAVMVESHVMRRYSDGYILARKAAGKVMASMYGSEWMVIHRAKYHQLLLNEAMRHGAEVKAGCDVVDVKTDADDVSVKLHDGRSVDADVVIGADGLWSRTRKLALDDHTEPSETGDLAYRGTFSEERLRNTQDRGVQELLEQSDVQVWLGPDKHVVFYPVNDKTEYNLVLLRPDNLPSNARTGIGSLEEMRQTFEGWDPRLTRMIAELDTALKWKLCHCEEFDAWVSGSFALLGDACHSTLPYQAQGAAMAVEDGATLGVLLGKLQRHLNQEPSIAKPDSIHAILRIYEKLRKARTTINVHGASSMQDFFHLPDGDAQRYRDEILHEYSHTQAWPKDCRWPWGDAEYQESLLGFDIVEAANEEFEQWKLNHE